jgi:putative transposase
VFNQFRHLKQKPYWGNHFWSRGYCVDTIGLDAEKIRLHVKSVKPREIK